MVKGCEMKSAVTEKGSDEISEDAGMMWMD